MRRARTALVVDSIDVDDAPTRVYSLEVEGLHSFAVGELAAWVHNALGAPSPFTGLTPGGIAQKLISRGFKVVKKNKSGCACGMTFLSPKSGATYHIDCVDLQPYPHVDVDHPYKPRRKHKVPR